MTACRTCHKFHTNIDADELRSDGRRLGDSMMEILERELMSQALSTSVASSYASRGGD
jgi:hypothetical protein